MVVASSSVTSRRLFDSDLKTSVVACWPTATLLAVASMLFMRRSFWTPSFVQQLQPRVNADSILSPVKAAVGSR